MKIREGIEHTKYVVGEKANPPKNPRRPPKKGKVMPTNIVKAEINANTRLLELYGTMHSVKRA